MKTIINITMTAALAALLSSCSSTQKQEETEKAPVARPDHVIERIDNLSSRPSWISESEPFRIQGGNVVSIGLTEIPGDHRVSAAYRIAQNNAKAGIATAIEQKLEFIFQNSEEGSSFDTTQARFIGAESSKLLTNHIRPGKNYWEKVASWDEFGNQSIKYKVFSSVTMPEAEFKRAIKAAIKKAEGGQKLSQTFSTMVDKHWDQFTNAQ